jgi:putative ABC transport system permease protein
VKLFLGVSIGFREIWSHKFRSFLTMLGVILGVACLLSTLALLNGIATGMMEVLTRTGGIEKVVIDNKDPSPHLKELAYLSPGKTWADVVALRKGVPLVDLVTGESRLHGASISSGATTIYESVVGTTPEYAEMNEFELHHGRMIAQLDLDNANRVVVLGARVAEQIWPDRPNFNPVGETLVINGRPFTVIGTFPLFETETQQRRKALGIDDAAKARRERRGTTSPGGGRGRRFWDPFYMKNMAVVVPLTTLIQEFKGASIGSDGGDAGADVKLDVISFRVADMAYLEETLNQARRVIEGTHRGIDDFGFTTREDWFESINRSVQGTRASGGLIAAISLLVGGIGITNIMLASISERVREIGVRRAIGAKGRDIFVQFLVESTILAVIGGLLGLVSGFGMMRLLEALSPSENAPVVDAASIALAFAAAVAIGLLSGIYPAWRAARLNPIEALRYG